MSIGRSTFSFNTHSQFNRKGDMHDKTLRSVLDLQSSRRIRDRRGLFFIEGVRHFVTAVDCRASFDAIVYSPKLLSSALAEKLVRHQRRSGIPVTKVSPESFRSISKTKRASGVAAILRQHISPLECIDPTDGNFWLVLNTVRSPGNLGTLVRTSAAIGGGGIILLGPTVDPYNPITVRSSMAALFRQRLVRTGLAELRRWIDKHNLQVVGASPDGRASYCRQCYRRPTLIALGDERTGLSDPLASLCHTLVRIPMLAEVDSLNLGVAGGLMMYEVTRSSGALDSLLETQASIDCKR